MSNFKLVTKSVVLISSLGLTLTACFGEYTRILGGKFKISRTNGNGVVIFHNNGKIVAGNVTKMSIKLPFVTGYNETSNPNESPSGYFIFNTDTEQRDDGLTEPKWRLELKKIGWQDPKLSVPD